MRSAFTRPPHRLLVEPQVRAALEEDLGRAGDITSQLTIPADKTADGPAGGAQARPHRRADLRRGRVPAGRSVVAFRRCPRLTAARSQPARCSPPSAGRRAAILTAERVALNFLGHLSGVATATAALVKAVEGTRRAHRLHPQDPARPADLAEICRALRRRLQSPLRPG